MLFPEKLDDRTFRLFVQRTCQLIRNKLELTKSEQHLADLLFAYPELGFLQQEQDINIDARFSAEQFNPFLVIAALWQVRRQFFEDAPKGFHTTVVETFDTSAPDAQQFFLLAKVYLALYLRTQEKNIILDQSEYLYEIQYILNNRDEFKGLERQLNYPESSRENDDSIVSQGIYNEVFQNVVHSMHDEQSVKPVSVDSTLRSVLHAMPTSWVGAMCTFWQLPEQTLKREKIKQVENFFSIGAVSEQIRENLKSDEIDALTFLKQNDGFVKYDLLAKKYGDEQKDSYWWETELPQSLIGRLRLKGLLAVGLAAVEGGDAKIAMIPVDIRELVEKVLRG